MAKSEHGELTVAYDRRTQIVQLRGCGSWTVDMLRQHQGEIEAVLKVARRDRKQLLVFSDITQSVVQSKAVTEEISNYNPIAFGDSDRVAMVVGSSLLKMQMRRITSKSNWEFFMSPTAAMNWLLAHEAGTDPGRTYRSSIVPVAM